ncbi:MAG: hypothetical protein V4787_25040 [Pseudomonadota bacterium]
MSSLALFSPMSLRAGGDVVGASLRRARPGLAPLRRNGMAVFLEAMRQLTAARPAGDVGRDRVNRM